MSVSDGLRDTEQIKLEKQTCAFGEMAAIRPLSSRKADFPQHRHRERLAEDRPNLSQRFDSEMSLSRRQDSTHTAAGLGALARISKPSPPREKAILGGLRRERPRRTAISNGAATACGVYRVRPRRRLHEKGKAR
ncbi:hypothetical protein SKAU_G00323740 [Synaphobranchus kaupii]|uniref:Uncharacterized protein n=1 Tax=Synaphobranchus kaupii TaxID=118154 RepID=A0A9Q1EP62_SYNKA|nr:hypothetical protein SKAU_G00323740 [Synaphobranchus kaupii]